MATNVTQKDKTLNEIMAWCDQLSTEIKRTEDATTDRTYGKLRGLYLVYEHCRSLLGYSGNMPTEVPNQSEDTNMKEAYLRGRDAPPADAEVEAVAKKLLWWDMAPAWEDVMPSDDCFWTLAEPGMRANYIRDAREMLGIARKAVSE